MAARPAGDRRGGWLAGGDAAVKFQFGSGWGRPAERGGARGVGRIIGDVIALLIVGGLVAGTLTGCSMSGGGARTADDQGIVFRSKPGENPLRGGPYQF